MDDKFIMFEKSKLFALRIIKLFEFLQEEKREYVISKQILRSGTSIGANIAESIFAQSRADFISKLSISLKEASETKYWIELLVESRIVTQNKLQSLENDCVGLIKMLSASIRTAKKVNVAYGK